MNVNTSPFGTMPDGTVVHKYSLVNDAGLEAHVITYGAILSSVRMPDRNGDVSDVTLGFDTLDGYLSDEPYFGATVGRFANRIARATFDVGGKTYKVVANDGAHHLHGGIKGFDKHIWDADSGENNGNVFVRFTRKSPDGEEGYPGNLAVGVTYCLTSKNELIIEYRATTDAETPINLTNHTYWNLGAPGESIADHHVQLNADRYLQVGEDLIPMSEPAPVSGTAFDFVAGKTLGPALQETGGFDHCFIIRDTGDKLKSAAKVFHSGTGRTLEIWATQPGVQFYTANFLDGIVGRDGISYDQHTAFCLETENYPDAINQASFPDPILRPGETYSETTIHRFSWEG